MTRSSHYSFACCVYTAASFLYLLLLGPSRIFRAARKTRQEGPKGKRISFTADRRLIYFSHFQVTALLHANVSDASIIRS